MMRALQKPVVQLNTDVDAAPFPALHEQLLLLRARTSSKKQVEQLSKGNDEVPFPPQLAQQRTLLVLLKRTDSVRTTVLMYLFRDNFEVQASVAVAWYRIHGAS